LSGDGRIRLFVVSATRLYRDGLADILGREGFDVVGTAPNALDDAASIERARPDVVLLEVVGTQSLPAVHALTASGAKVVALALPEVADDVLAYAEAGISGYVSRDAGSIADLVASVESVARGELLCSPQVAGALVRRVADLAARATRPRPRALLTRRQLEIVGLIEAGLSNKEIARRLCIEVPTVKNHLHAIFEKLDVHRRGDAVARARADGLPVVLARARD
jgi:two-component system nitrate/nitrite response regulator NarL